MKENEELSTKAEKIARKMSKRLCGTESMWELCLIDAYKMAVCDKVKKGKRGE